MKIKNRIAALLVAFTFVVATFFIPKSVYAITIYSGIDIYSGNNVTDYAALRNQGIQVVIAKATQGIDYKDSSFAYRCGHVRAAGLKFGAYHFAGGLSRHTPEMEAQNFLNAVKGQTYDTCLFLDIEDYYVNKNYYKVWGKQEAINFVNAFINYVQARGYKIGVYCCQSFYYNNLAGNIPNVPVWLANYSQKPAHFPDVNWQYSATGRLNGATGNLDMDYFNDSIFTGQAPSASNSTQSIKTQNSKYWGGYNVNRVRSLQHLLNGLGLANLNEDGELGSQTLRAMYKLPVAKLKGYHNAAYTDWLEVQLGQVPDHIYGTEMSKLTYSFQKSKNINVDKEIGIQTLKELLKQP